MKFDIFYTNSYRFPCLYHSSNVIVCINRMNRWFKGKIKFACTSCGKCCKSLGKTKVYVNPSEVVQLADLLSINEEKFRDEYLESHTDLRGRELKSLKTHSSKNQCVFLDGNKCSVYEARPTQCRTYPFWPQHMIGKAEWVAESRNCEGMSVVSDISKEHTLVAETSSLTTSDIALNMIVHQIHDRGHGEDWTYNEAVELLKETTVVQPNLIDDFQDDFFHENESKIGELKRNTYCEQFFDQFTIVGINILNLCKLCCVSPYLYSV